MGRKKSDWIEDDGDSSGDESDQSGRHPQGTHDEDAEFELFANPYKRARRGDKQADKDAAMYGVFGDDSSAPQPQSRSRGDISK